MAQSGAKILLVDDSEICRTVATCILEDSGHCVIALESPLGLDEALDAERPDLVLVDVDMPSMSGEKVVELIRLHDPTSRAVLYSDRPEAELRRLAALSGAVGFIPKSVGPQDLVRLVETFISGADREEPPTRPSGTLERTPQRSSIPAP